ncbi:Uncharacterised protein [Vibrio cholerae]|nr:Uncharacterised protein [Vibrio cholerae]
MTLIFAAARTFSRINGATSCNRPQIVPPGLATKSTAPR